MALLVALQMADRQVISVAVAALAAGRDVFKRGVFGGDVLAAHPARHLAVQLAGYGGVDFDAQGGECAHGADRKI